MDNFRITVTIDLSLDQAKRAFRHHFGHPTNHKVTKQDIAEWIGVLVTADIEAETAHLSGDDEDESYRNIPQDFAGYL